MGTISATPGESPFHMEKVFFHMKFASDWDGESIFHMEIVKKYMNRGYLRPFWHPH
jgi:hypothetical protein